MKKYEKRIVALTAAVALFFGVLPSVSAMHIMEGYLTPIHCIIWGVLCLPFLAVGFFSIKKKLSEHRRTMILLAICGAFIFVISSLKIPSVTGSCSHMTGTGLGAILFGPTATSILGIIVLLFQAILLAHGGLTTIGANTFSMAIAGPILTFVLYKLGKKMKVNNKVNVFIATALGDLFTYCVTAFQLSLAYPSAEGGIGASAVKFLGIFALTQVPLAIIEGLISVVIVSALEVYAKNELADLGYNAKVKSEKSNAKTAVACVIAVVLIAFVPFFALKGAEFGGSDDAGSEMISEIQGEYEPWAEPILEKYLGGEIPGEIESLLFCLQTGIGTSIIFYNIGKLMERHRNEKSAE